MCHLYSHKQRHTVQTLDIHLHVMHAHLRRVHTRLRDTSTKNATEYVKMRPQSRTAALFFIQVCVWGSDQNFNPSPQTHREWLTAVVVFFIFRSLCHSPAVFLFLTSALLSLSAEKLHCHMHNSYSEAVVGNQLLNCQAASDKKLKAQDEWILQVKWDVQE